MRGLLAGIVSVVGIVTFIAMGACGRSKRSVRLAPRVDNESALAKRTDRPPDVTVTIAADGTLRRHAVASWSAFAGLDPAHGTATTLPDLTPADARRPDHDDPPPPREESDEDDENGPDGLITEDIMGKAESEADIERRRWHEYRHARGLVGRRDEVVSEAPRNWPTRVTTVSGELLPDRGFTAVPDALVLAAPDAPATALIDVVHATEGAIGVEHGGEVRMLALTFVHESSRLLSDTPAIEVRLREGRVEVEAIPSAATAVPWPATSRDAGELGRALQAARARRKLDPRTALDVLVEDATTTQQLVDLLVVLADTGTAAIALGRIPAPSSVQAQRRGRRISYLRWGPSYTLGPVKIDDVRTQVRGHRAALEACNKPTTDTHDELVVDTRFTISPAGSVEDLELQVMAVVKKGRVEEVLSSKHPDVTACVTPILGALTFASAKEPTKVHLPFGLYD